MNLNPIGIAVPFFFGLMLLELWVSTRRGVSVFRLNDGIANLICEQIARHSLRSLCCQICQGSCGILKERW